MFLSQKIAKKIPCELGDEKPCGICKSCINYETTNTVGNDLSQKIAKKIVCEKCDYSTCSNFDFQKHIKTKKHIGNDSSKKVAEKSQDHKFICNYCNKIYLCYSGLWRHKKKCANTNDDVLTNDNQQLETMMKIDVTDKDIIVMLLKQNNDFKELLIEQNKTITDMANKNQIINNNTVNTNTNNSHNKTFNLQVFLNETCKDAMNINDFVDSLQIQLSDLENVGTTGFVNGISNIIVKSLKALDITKRPVHCNDQKRETVYIKHDNEWYNDSKIENSEGPENQKLKKAIKQIAHKNICMIKEWKAKYPDCIYADSRKSDLYNHIIYESMDHNENNSNKIIKNIAKEVYIDKNKTN